jgi:NadR type nicotinamide-nucleotide adenylyltransferase
MYKTGVFAGKFLPPHRGHLSQIINSATQCETLYVVVSDNKNATIKLCGEARLPVIDANLRVKWLSQELQGFEHIKIVLLDETNIPEYPHGWFDWSNKLRSIIKEKIDIIFGGDREYRNGYNLFFPDTEFSLFDYKRERYPVSSTLIRENPFKYWDYILGSARPFFAKKVLITGTESCVDGETEFFNGYDWKKISDYIKEDKVLQYNSNGTAELVYPYKYIKSNSEFLWKLKNSFGNWSHVFSEDHEIVYISSKGNLNKKPFSEIMKTHFEIKSGFQGKLINHFNYSGNFDIDENKLRLMIAVSADGTKSKNKWRIRLKKQRKIERLRKLILNANLNIDERIYKDGYSNFYIPLEFGTKLFDKSVFMNLSKKSQNVFMDEIFNWDGYKNNFYSTLKNNVDVVQFIFSSNNKKINIYKNKPKTYKVSLSPLNYTSISMSKENFKHRDKMITKFIPKDGHKYCFTVPSGMLILRRDNHIFVTGNCGKTTTAKYLAKIFYTSWSEEVGMYYAGKFLGGNETVYIEEDFGRIAYLQYETDMDALQKANKIVFYDTDAVVTQYYAELYLGKRFDLVKKFIDPTRYDAVLLLAPTVPWVDNGMRFNGEQKRREELNEKLCLMYRDYNFYNVTVIYGNYNQRLETCISLVNNLIGK